jgi:hypothetical protein
VNSYFGGNVATLAEQAYIFPFPFMGAFCKIAKSFVMFVRHGTTLLPLDGFSRNLVFEHFFEHLP